MKKEKNRKQFYNNKHRNEKWTEKPQGRPIDFADKYAENGGYSDKYDETKRTEHQLAVRKKEKKKRYAKNLISVVLAVVIILIGYVGMDTYIIRHAVPAKSLVSTNKEDGSFSQIDLNLYSMQIQSVSLDNSTMLASVIADVQIIGYNSITFEAKRNDGTIGYQSELATIDTYGAKSNVGNDSRASISKLNDNDILPIARICCYKDNVVPVQDSNLAIKKGDKIYRDKDGNAYLNPNNEQVYSYILDMVRELYSHGVKVFVLYGCSLPDEIADGYNDGFKSLSKKLTADLNGEVKILQEVNVSIAGMDLESGKITNSAISSEIKNFKQINKNQIYYISTNIDKTRVRQLLIDNGITNFILP